MKKNIICLLPVLYLIAVMLGGCKKGSVFPERLSGVTLNQSSHSIFYAPMYVAIEEDYFKEEGIALTLVTSLSTDETMAALLSGEADIGLMGSEASIHTYATGIRDHAVNFAQLTQRAGNFLIARQPIEDFSWDILKGANVLGGPPGSMSQMVLTYILKKHNIDPSADLQFNQGMGSETTSSAFSAGNGDFTLELEPLATTLEQRGNGYVVAFLGEYSGYIPYTAFSAKRSYMEANRDLIQSFTNALQKGIDYVMTHTPQEIAKVIAPQFGETGLDILVTALEYYCRQNVWKESLIFTEDSFILLQNIMEEANILKNRIPYGELVNIEFAENAFTWR